MMADPFDDLLGLEDKFYDEGFQLGSNDGATAARIEGRVFGIEKGFEKYVEAGRLHGKSLIWAGRLPLLQDDSPEKVVVHAGNECSSATTLGNAKAPPYLPFLSSNIRLEKHIKVLYALTEPVSLSTENTEEAISDFDDRLKRGGGKVKIIERLIGEDGSHIASDAATLGGTGGNIEDVSVLKARH